MTLMTALPQITPALLLQLGGAFALGLAAGAVHSAALWWNVKLLVSGGPALQAVLGHVLRWGVTIGVLVFTALQGAGPLIAATLGITIMRAAVVHRVKAQP